jgi:membrane-bound metal-dependent hydrolase YbcI (DUF457 family)
MDTMLGPSHALSGAAVWLTGSWALEQFSQYHQTPLEIAVGTAVCAGGALLPDLDMSGRVTTGQGGATVAHAFGRVSLFVAELLEKFSLGVYDLTKTRHDPHRANGHRTLTHTLVFNVGVGIGTWQLALHYGEWAVLPILFMMIGLALRGLFGKRSARAGWIVVTVLAAAAAYFAWRYLHGERGYPLLGVAVGVGGIVHLLGDVITSHGCPVFWPLPISGKTWHCVGVPNALAVRVGGKVEIIGLRLLFLAVALAGAGGLVGPALLQRFNLRL